MENSQKKVNANFKVLRNWTLRSKKLKKQYPQLTDADLKLERGKETDLLKRLESRLNKTREEIIDIIRDVETPKIGFKPNN